mgnify:CR=1 FL=1
MELFQHVLIYMGYLHLVLPVLNFSIMDAGILIMVQQVRLMMFSLNMVDYLSLSIIFRQKSPSGGHQEEEHGVAHHVQ